MMTSHPLVIPAMDPRLKPWANTPGDYRCLRGVVRSPLGRGASPWAPWFPKRMLCGFAAPRPPVAGCTLATDDRQLTTRSACCLPAAACSPGGASC